MFEKKRGKRFLASVMALVMLLSLAPVGALAADEETFTEESPAVALPANEVDPKPVVTDEENTENTNEELTPPPAMRVIQEYLLIIMILPRRFPKRL